MTAIAVAGEVCWATNPASAAPTPCMASMPEECSPSAWPLSSSGVSVIRRCWSMRVAEYPTEASTHTATATWRSGWVRNARYGTASSSRSQGPSRSRHRSETNRPARVSPASIPSAVAANSVPACRGEYATNRDSQPTIRPFGTQSARYTVRRRALASSVALVRQVCRIEGRPAALAGRRTSPNRASAAAVRYSAAPTSNVPRGDRTVTSTPPAA